MTRIVADEAMVSQLQNLRGPADICDAAGRPLGRFWPPFDPAQHEGLEPPLSREEIQRRKQAKGKTYTTAEVLAYLEKL